MLSRVVMYSQTLPPIRAAAVVLLFVSTSLSADEGAPDFSKEVLPILSNKCFVCHGPDAEEDELRLDSFGGATVDLGGYQAIDPESPKDSELVFRIHDKEDPMPPEKAEGRLTDSERDILSRWVKSGGEYSKHWAFVAPEKKSRNIDTAVESKLKVEGHDFAPQADKPTLARRAALILTGLPPEMDQLKRYLANDSPGAYEQLLDELLSSSRFGEHQARYWLDAVRYGDTHGLHLDNRRGIFPYRDWVVKAFNENLPFDDFITWQLAGDLLPEPTLEQLTATGYVRMNPTTSEGGAIPAEFQAKNNFDRVENLGTVFLGMTLNCVRCHTHKYDPIVHQEYYELLAFFNSTAESPMDGNAYVYAPVLEVPGSLQGWKEWESLEKERDAILVELDRAIKDGQLEPGLLSYAEKTLGWKTENWKVTKDLPFKKEQAEEKDWKDIPNAGALGKDRFGNRSVAKHISFTLSLDQDQTLLYKSNAEFSSSFSNQKLALLPSGKGPQKVSGKLRGIDGKIKAKFEILNPWEAVAKQKKWSAASELERVIMAGDPYAKVFPLDLQKKAAALSKKLIRAHSEFSTTLIAKDLTTRRETRILDRGEYSTPIGEALEPGVFAVMNPFPADAPKNRLGLAQWLTSPDHPLVTRVLVNRIWQSVFGEALVRSPEDFGLQGQQATHPDLLDFLAVDFREKGWDYKQLIKEIVMSRTFQQDSAWRSDIPNDSGNRKLARGPGFRLDAEVIRDTGLWASGLLESKMGGEGVKPYQPEGLWVALAHPGSNTKNYEPDTDDRVNQRSLYVYWKRTSPHPMMTLFDAPSREVSCVRRSRGNTPLQSLGLLNEPQRMTMARTYAANLISSAKKDKERLKIIFEMVTCRPPTAAEEKACLTLLKQAVERYTSSPGDASSLTKQQDSSPELAGWTQVVNTILASDSAILLY